MRLRTVLALSAVLLAVVGLVATVALLLTTTAMRRGTEALSEAVESVRAAEELQGNLLVHSRELRLFRATGEESHHVARDDAARAARRSLETIRHFISTPAEGKLVEETTRSVDRYLSMTGSGLGTEGTWSGNLDEAIALATRVVELNLLQARATSAHAIRMDAVSDMIGYTAAVLLLGGIAIALYLARTRVYLPLLWLREAIRRFGGGEKASRAALEGPGELKDIASEFNQLADALCRQEKMQLEFLAGVAHDLRNPLNVVKLSLGRLDEKSSHPVANGRASVTLSRISKQVDRLNRMVDDLLDRTRIEAGNLELRLEDLDLREAISDVVEFFEASTERHQFDVRTPTDAVWVRGDATRLEQVLSNLLSNAVKYSPEGGRITVSLSAVNDQALLSVTDEGLGIAAEDLQRVFEPFSRSKSHAETIPGVGLGLAVSRRIVKAHGGELSLQSQPGVGSTFSVLLPLHPAPLAPDTAGEHTNAPAH